MVPAWTLDQVCAGRRRPPGRVSPDAWRLYGACVDWAYHNGEPARFDATVARLGAAMNASASTGRRRLSELETAGMLEVAERSGGWLSVRVILDQAEAETAAERYAHQGRCRLEPLRDPLQTAALTPANKRHSPVPVSGTPQESPPKKPQTEESLGLPVADDLQHPGASTRVTAKAVKPTKRPMHSVPLVGKRAAAAGQVYRALPTELTGQIGERASTRVLRAIAAELDHRSAAELADRIARNWVHWQTRLIAGEPLRDPVAIAIRLVRRGLGCPDVRCEDGYQLDLDAPCKACAQVAAEREEHGVFGGDRDGVRNAMAEATATFGPSAPPIAEVLVGRGNGVDSRRYASLARRLLAARDLAHREAILVAWENE